MKKSQKAVSEAMGIDEYVEPKACIHLSDKDYPSIGSLNIDQEVTFVVKGKVVGLHKNRYSKDQKRTAEIEIQEITTEEKD